MKTLLQFPPPRDPDEPTGEVLYFSVWEQPHEARRRCPTVAIPTEPMRDLVFSNEEEVRS